MQQMTGAAAATGSQPMEALADRLATFTPSQIDTAFFTTTVIPSDYTAICKVQPFNTQVQAN